MSILEAALADPEGIALVEGILARIGYRSPGTASGTALAAGRERDEGPPSSMKRLGGVIEDRFQS